MNENLNVRCIGLKLMDMFFVKYLVNVVMFLLENDMVI